MSVLIFGMGAIGCVYAHTLQQAGVKVVGVCRSNYDAIKRNGIGINYLPDTGEVNFKPAGVFRSVEEAAAAHEPFDHVLVCSKALPGTACQAIGPAINASAETSIILIQNGIGIEDEYKACYPLNPVISSVVWIPAKEIRPGFVEATAITRTIFGTYPSSAPAAHKARLAHFAELWKSSGGPISIRDDIQPDRWAKLALNCAFNPMCSLARVDGANLLLSSEQADHVVTEVVKEVYQVASSSGIDLSTISSSAAPAMTEEQKLDAFILEAMAWHRKSKETGGKEPSMLLDVRNGRTLELEAILGNVVRIASANSVNIPRLETLYCLMKAIEFGRVRPLGWMPPVL